MKAIWISALCMVVVTGVVHAQDKTAQVSKGAKHSNAEIQKDILDHRAMADAHLAAAKCLDEGKGEKVCHGQLAKDCKGLGIGTLCGMKHKH